MRLLGFLGLLVLAAPALAPYDASRQFPGYQYAPPMRPHLVDADGRWHAPFAYAVRLQDPLERRYTEDRAARIGSFAGSEPWFLLGSDALGRDVLSRLLIGARLSLGIALAAALISLALGAVAGAAAGYAGGWTDAVLMRIADGVMVLPAMYVVLALRGALPLVLTTGQVFGALVAVLSLIGWPVIARGVRAILVVERGAEYAEAARACGAGAARLVLRHLLPAARGFLGVQAAVLVPAFVMAEATLSFVGLGFAAPTPSWGAMLNEAAAIRVAADAPWLLAPAGAIVATVFVINAADVFRDRRRGVPNVT
ncbi:MAG TPA: ABC transporter permease [Vicinamibacterales bacterium]|nr:ABC transporter permease [Vicinamibacterales bacterium]